MRRWNGWGDDQIHFPLPDAARARLETELGPALQATDASLESVLAAAGAPRLIDHPLLTTDPEERLGHSCGQGLPDWVALRFGRLPSFVDAVAYPTKYADLDRLYALAVEQGSDLVPFGGGTSLLGQINPRRQANATIAVDLRQLCGLHALDGDSGLATFGAGTVGPDIERALAAEGFTLGHYPQSFEYATLGGWIATRSSGQQSLGYGRIEDLFAGGRLWTPIGSWALPAIPASAAGPDLRQMVLGSEGRLGILTEATVRVRHLPQAETFAAAVLPDWETGLQTLRRISSQPGALSMLRLLDPLETSLTFLLSGHTRLATWAERALGLLAGGQQRCLLIYGLTGERSAVSAGGRRVVRLVRRHAGWPLGPWIGQQWRRARFRTPYLRNALWRAGFAVETFESSFTWAQLGSATEGLLSALDSALAPLGDRSLAFGHVSHTYPDGACLYVTTVFRHHADPDRTLSAWRALKTASLTAIQQSGGTVSDHHGVGTDHRQHLAPEKGRIGLQLLAAVQRQIDPGGILNPGKLLPDMEDGGSS
ncbi:MAG: FAD-binding oxidoreductase [Anaerolineales bacterium]